MSNYKEIVTKAVVSKGKKLFTTNHSVEVSNPSTVLGCWVINHNFKGVKNFNNIVIDGSYDVNIWYSYDNDTKTTVVTKPIKYKEIVSVNEKNSTDSQKDIIVRSLKQPSCVNAKEKGKSIEFEIEKELGIEVVGDTKVKIAIEDDEEPWDEIKDEDDLNKVENEIDNEVKEDFIDKK